MQWAQAQYEKHVQSKKHSVEETHCNWKHGIEYNLARIAQEEGGLMDATIGWSAEGKYCYACIQYGPQWWTWDPMAQQVTNM